MAWKPAYPTGRKKKPVLRSQRLPGGGVTTRPPRPPAPRGSPKPKAPTPVAVPQLAAAPAAQGGPPPLSAEGETARIAARQGYGITMNDVNRQLQELTRAFGGAGQVQQFGYTPGDPRSIGTDVSSTLGGFQTFDPSGTREDAYKRSLNQQNALAALYRNKYEGEEFTEAKHTADNTFFSGMTIDDMARVNTDYDRGLTQAKNDYQSAIADLVSQLGAAQISRNTTIQEANNAEAAAEAERRRQAEAQAAEAAAAARNATAAAGAGNYVMQAPIIPPWLRKLPGTWGSTFRR